MGEFIVADVKWKKGEEGIQQFIIFESDGVTRRIGTGKSYTFSFWIRGAAAVKGTGALVATDAVQGEYDYTVTAANTDTILDHYIGEIIEDPTGTKLRSETFKVFVEESSDL